MTTPQPTKQLAKDVATELDRRRRRKRLVLLVLVLALVIAAALYLRFGKGWGLGTGTGKTGTGTGSGSAAKADERCTIRVSKDGISVDGAPMKRDEAVAACKKTHGGALVTVTGDARQGDWDELKAALEAVRVKIYMRGEEAP